MNRKRKVPVLPPTSISQVIPTVSVVVPCYNYGRFLPLCVNSVLSQRDVEVDVLVIDDASTDDSGEIAQSLGDLDERVKVLRHPRNRGHISTYNEGLDSVTGTYCMLLSADDLLTPGALARATALFEANPSVGMAYGSRIPFVGKELPIPRTSTTGWSLWSGDDWIRAICRLGSNVLSSPEVVLRTDVQRKVGHYRADLPHSGDLEMWLRVAAVSDVGRIDDADQAYYREHTESMSRSQYYSVPLKDLEERRQAFQVAFEGLAGGVPGAASLRDRAMYALADESLEVAIAEQQVASPSVSTNDAAQSAVAFALKAHPLIARSIRYRIYRLRESRARIFGSVQISRADRASTRLWKSYAWRRRKCRLREVSSFGQYIT